MSDLSEVEKNDLINLGWKCVSTEHDKEHMGWFLIEQVGPPDNPRLWIHKFGATMVYVKNGRANVNSFYNPELRLALNLLRRKFSAASV